MSAYVAGIKEKTLAFLEQLMILHTCPGKDAKDLWPPLQKQAKAIASLRQRATDLAIDNKHFANTGVDGLRATEASPPICRNNNGTKEIILRPFCVDLKSAVDFVSREWRYDSDEVAAQCHAAVDPVVLPVCEYDCNHPTICLQTGRCDPVRFFRLLMLYLQV